jgi:hypothetical protein
MRKMFLALLILTGCDREEKPEAPTAAESQRLDDAEAMLNELGRNEEGPTPEDAGPSNRSE